MRGRRFFCGFLVSGVAFVALSPLAVAQDSGVALSEEKLELTEGTKHEHTTSITVTNVLSEPIRLSVTPVRDDPNCKVELDSAVVAANRNDKTIEVTLSKKCQLKKRATTLHVVATAVSTDPSPPPLLDQELEAALPDTTAPDFDVVVDSYAIAAGLIAFILIAALIASEFFLVRRDPKPSDAGGLVPLLKGIRSSLQAVWAGLLEALRALPKVSLRALWAELRSLWDRFLAMLKCIGARLSTPLPKLDAKWTFKDSWASNITVVGVALTGVFASGDLLKPLLGKSPDAELALMALGTALAAGLVVLAPLVLQACVSSKEKHSYITIGGLLLASGMTLTGAGGELGVIADQARHLHLGPLNSAIVPITVLAALALATYGFRSVRDLIVAGVAPPKSTKRSRGQRGVRADAEISELDVTELWDPRERRTAIL